MELNNITDVIEAYETDLIDTETVLQILEAQPTAIAIWVDGDQKYSYSKAETLKGLQEYKKYIESGNGCPIFFPEVADTSSGFSFNDACKPL